MRIFIASTPRTGSMWAFNVTRDLLKSAGKTVLSVDPKSKAEEMNAMKATFGVTDEDIAGLGRMYEAILSLSEEDIDALDDTGALHWMSQFRLATPLESQVCMNLNTLFVVAVDRLPASEMIRTLRDQFH